MNVGPGVGTSIRELAEAIKRHTGYTGRIVWDTSKPNGAMLKTFDVTKMRKELDWSPPTSLDEGLAETIAWAQENYRTMLQPSAR
jgi:GDP-L-fucose synthase